MFSQVFLHDFSVVEGGRLCVTDLGVLSSVAESTSDLKPSIKTVSVEDTHNCHLFSTGINAKTVYLCAAEAKRIR